MDGPTDKKDTPAPAQIKIGEQVYDENTVKNLVEQHQALQDQMKALEPIIKTAERYEVPPADLIAEAEGSFAKMRELMELGILDKNGEVVKRETPRQEPKPLFSKEKSETSGLTQEALLEALKPILSPLVGKIKDLEVGQERVAGSALHNELRLRYGNDFSADDFRETITRAKKDQNKTVVEHAAEVFAESKTRATKTAQEQEDAILKKYGLDPNKLRADSGDTSPEQLIAGKRISFSKKRGDKDTVTPREATRSFLERVWSKG